MMTTVYGANCFDSKLPWSTCNEDLVDLFSTIGKVERAEIQYEPNGRSRGTGVVEFDNPETAETAIGKDRLDEPPFPPPLIADLYPQLSLLVTNMVDVLSELRL
jgi:RNA recognition motif-containing protein